jgi:RimJ/RimL family protein N-acetyltransferase
VGHIELREVRDDDLDAIFEMMRDPEAIALAAFTAADPDDRDAFDSWMNRNMSSPDTSVFVITENSGFAGSISAFTIEGQREVGFWLPRLAWGRGIATEALRQLISREPIRPLFARVAAHNHGSIAVLRKAGFAEVSRNTAYAPGLGRETEEIVFALMPAVDGV